jgi:hypothetical protein
MLISTAMDSPDLRGASRGFGLLVALFVLTKVQRQFILCASNKITYSRIPEGLPEARYCLKHLGSNKPYTKFVLWGFSPAHH